MEEASSASGEKKAQKPTRGETNISLGEKELLEALKKTGNPPK